MQRVASSRGINCKKQEKEKEIVIKIRSMTIAQQEKREYNGGDRSWDRQMWQ